MEGPHYCWRRILFLIGHQFESQPKVKLPNAVVLGIVDLHRCEDFTNQAEVLIDQSLLDKLSLYK